MSASGFFLLFFLLGHLAGNLPLLLPNVADSTRLQFNAYAHFMTTNPAVKVLSYVTYFFILLHAVLALILTRDNRRARPIGYRKSTRTSASWAAKNMGLLGSLILIFLVVHLRSFWYEMHWGAIGVDAAGNRDLYEVVVVACSALWYVAFYVLSMGLLGLHLAHGFWSAFQSVGASAPRYSPIIRTVGLGFAVVVPLLFASIPIVLYLRQVIN